MRKVFAMVTMLLAMGATLSLSAQRVGNSIDGKGSSDLHAVKSSYTMPYGDITEAGIKAELDRVLSFLEENSAVGYVDADGNPTTDYSDITKISEARALFGMSSYEWGVTYSGMLSIYKITGDERYAKYVRDRFEAIGEAFPAAKKYADQLKKERAKAQQTGNAIPMRFGGRGILRGLTSPGALDDCGAMTAAMIKSTMIYPEYKKLLKPVIENGVDWVMNGEHRLADGTLARNRPDKNAVWLDDMYMGIPALAYYGVYANDNKYSREAAKQILLFKEKMWVPETQLFRHGWIEAMGYHPAFYWGRANGWAILTMCDVLDVLPENDPDRPAIIELLQQHIVSLAKLQSGDGFWHQLLDRNDSYMETSATAIYAYCIAHAINEGWIDGMAFGPVAQLAWEAVTTQINENGAVEGVCVGTGMAFDPAFYYFRNTSVNARHGYGPVLLAGGEMIRLIKNYYPRMNDAAILYYKQDPGVSGGIFSVK
ncbi:MAG: glycoside hydrolase family 88 protein [Tidjanibacter sp.]|nr:glycoside hydrolase family 88 protein [Tidjanibacter sp.]